MSTVRTCTTPEDGWSLYSHFIANQLLVIQLSMENVVDESDVDKNRRERIISDTWAQLAGNLYMVMRRMKLNGHDDVSAKMMQIIDMVVEQDLREQNVRNAVHAKHEELNVQLQNFVKELARLRAIHAR